MAAIMNCPHCKIPMTRIEVQRRNCVRLDYTCPGCAYTDFDFQALTTGRIADCPQISNGEYRKSDLIKGNPPPTKRERERWHKYWLRRKLKKLEASN